MTSPAQPMYSASGFLRRMQMSNKEVWVLVEGPLDRCFYDRLCRANEGILNDRFAVGVPSDLIQLEADGKQNLLNLYRYLRKRHALRSDLCGKRTVVLFMLDKDIDDLERTTLSAMVISQRLCPPPRFLTCQV
jgi:hypothetical protein